MTNIDIAHQRLSNQRLAGTVFEKPGDVVGWLGAVQAQDYLGSLWAVGLRMRKAVEADIEQALAEKTILRTWPMRGTLHFVAAADARWMLELLTPRIVAGSARRLQQQFGLDETVFARSKDLLVSALEGGKQLQREALYQVLEAGGIAASGQRGLHILSRLAQDGLLCFGAREGKQQTFVLLSEWVPAARSRARDEALAELARRYFTSHGPATIQDFAWWSGLQSADARAGLEMAKPHLEQAVFNGRGYWLPSFAPVAKPVPPTAYLLPAYDEYTVAYQDRRAVLDPVYAKLPQAGNGIFNPTIVIDGQVVGTWRRSFKKDGLVITPSPFAKLNEAETRALTAAANRYGKFIGASVILP
jgi:hypothetical protein